MTSGDTLFGLGLRYGITSASIALENNLSEDSALQLGQRLLIPWPTATPPLVPVEVAVGDETIIADPTECIQHEIQSGDTLFGIALRYRIDLRALMEVNRLTEQSILQPGDAICIPSIIRGGALPPTPGPSPTPSATSPPSGPALLWPANRSVVDAPDGAILLQWAAVKTLAPNEWYMVELTDLTDVDRHPLRGFSRNTSFRVPSEWRPITPTVHEIRWRVSIVRVTGQRDDGAFTYTFGGRASESEVFFWPGAVPTATPTAERTITPEGI